MLRPGTVGRRFWLVVALAALAAMGYAAYALAADTITATNDTYNAPTYTIDQGERPSFANGDASQHNVTARQNGPDGKALFSTATLDGGQSALVDGTQYLTAGTYTFFCTIHPTTMQATLVVSSNGTPQPRPSAALVVRTKTISKALKKGVVVAINPSSPAITLLSLVAKLGNATIGKAKFPSAGSHAPTNTIQLSKSGKRKLRTKSKATIRVVGNILFGAPATAKAKLK